MMVVPEPHSLREITIRKTGGCRDLQAQGKGFAPLGAKHVLAEQGQQRDGGSFRRMIIRGQV